MEGQNGAGVDLREVVPGGSCARHGPRRGPGQVGYLNSMEDIFAEADKNGEPCLTLDGADAETGALVGFVMISDNIPQPMDEDLIGPYYLWKLLIDEPFQGRRYGTATLDAVVDYGTRPGADVCNTSLSDGLAPRGFYLQYGFTTWASHVGRERPALDLTR